jgi:glycosyltransferase involved in cell wall biosynthesis
MPRSIGEIRTWKERQVASCSDFRLHPPISSDKELRDKRILLISPFLPFPPKSGARQRTYFLWKALTEIAPVDVILCNEILNPDVAADSLLYPMNFLGRFPWRARGYSLRRLFMKSTLERTINRLLHVTIPKNWEYGVDFRVRQSFSDLLKGNRYFLVVGRYLLPMVKAGLVGRIPCLLDVDDIDFDILAQRAQDLTCPRWRRFLHSAHSRQIKAAFEKWLPKFDGLWVTKAGDTRHAVTRNAAILPNIPYHFPGSAALNGSRSAHPIILTVGVLTYFPNLDGVDRFVREGWPNVRAAYPTAEYWLVGQNDPTIAKRWQAVPGVKVLGFVEDLASLYQESWFTLSPLWSGAGTNIKVLESLAFGRTCVTTVVGHRGFEDHLEHGDSLLVATTAGDLAEHTIRLIKDYALRGTLGKRGREIVQRDFSYEKFASIVHCQVEQALGEKFRK